MKRSRRRRRGRCQTSRPTEYATLKRWIAEGVQGLGDKPPIPRHPARKADLTAINAVRKLQVNSALGEFRIHFAGEPLAQYQVAYERDQKRLKSVTEPRLIETQFRSPQLLLWDLGPEDWHVVLRLPEYAARRRQTATAVQLPLLPEAVATTG